MPFQVCTVRPHRQYRRHWSTWYHEQLHHSTQRRHKNGTQPFIGASGGGQFYAASVAWRSDVGGGRWSVCSLSLSLRPNANLVPQMLQDKSH